MQFSATEYVFMHLPFKIIIKPKMQASKRSQLNSD